MVSSSGRVSKEARRREDDMREEVSVIVLALMIEMALGVMTTRTGV